MKIVEAKKTDTVKLLQIYDSANLLFPEKEREKQSRFSPIMKRKTSLSLLHYM